MDTEEMIALRHSGTEMFTGCELSTLDDPIYDDLQLLRIKDDPAYLRLLDKFILPKNDSPEELERLYYDIQQFNQSEYERHAKKRAGTVKIIAKLAKNFAEEMRLIRDNCGIPFISLHRIFNSMTTFGDIIYDLFEKPIDLQGVTNPKILISNTIPLDKRDEYVAEIGKRIYDLLLECYWVLYISATYELEMIMNIYKSHGLRLTKKYLYHLAVYPALEESVWRLNNNDELIEYLNYEFSCIFKFLPNFREYVFSKINRIAKHRMDLLNTPIVYHSDVASVGIVFGKGSIDGADSIKKSKDLEDEEDELSREYTTNKKEHDRKFLDAAKLVFTDEIFMRFNEKDLLAGPLANYRLRGKPKIPINWLIKIYKNIGLSLVEPHYNRVTQARYGLSPRTLRRYKGDLRNGHNASVPQTEASRSERIAELSKEKLEAKQHHLQGYITQRQLIKYLREDETIDHFNTRHGLQFRQYSYPTLIKKLNLLIKLKKISVLQTKSARQYEATEKNIYTIITEMINLPDNRE